MGEVVRKITWHPDPSDPGVTLPGGATDTHCHVFGPMDRFAFAPGKGAPPGDAPKERLFALHDRMGIERTVIVQSAVHGFDNAAAAEAIATRPGRASGVALAPPDISSGGIAALHTQGFRGVRFNYMAHLAPGATMDELHALSARLADAGWHLQIHMEAGLIADMAPALAGLPVPVVIDHMGRIDASQGVDQAPFAALMRLMERDHVWTKVSGVERASRADPPYDDALPFAARLVRDYPDRVLWGTDWPHPNFRAEPPDDGVLFALLPRIAPTPTALQALMVDNPARLYGFVEGN